MVLKVDRKIFLEAIRSKDVDSFWGLQSAILRRQILGYKAENEE